LADICVVKVEHDVENEFRNDDDDECEKEVGRRAEWREKLLLSPIHWHPV
jgi:hypothetical protein